MNDLQKCNFIRNLKENHEPHESYHYHQSQHIAATGSGIFRHTYSTSIHLVDDWTLCGCVVVYLDGELDDSCSRGI